MSEEHDKPLSLEQQLNLETATIAWSELVRHFARGVVVHVRADIDLLDVAGSLARDEVTQFQQWVEAGQVARASDDDARDWTARSPEFWCVVVAPWVVVQEKGIGETRH